MGAMDGWKGVRTFPRCFENDNDAERGENMIRLNYLAAMDQRPRHGMTGAVNIFGPGRSGV